MEEPPKTWIDMQDVRSFDNARYVINHATNPFLVLRGFAMIRPCIDDLEFLAIRDARAMGYSWERIAEAMNRQRQAVWKQYAPLLNEESATDSESEDEPA